MLLPGPFLCRSFRVVRRPVIQSVRVVIQSCTVPFLDGSRTEMKRRDLFDDQLDENSFRNDFFDLNLDERRELLLWRDFPFWSLNEADGDGI